MTPQQQIDPAVEAGILADRFHSLSQSVDEFRLRDDVDVAPEDDARLKAEAQALETRSHFFTADAIGATLLSIKSDLAHIKVVTAEAKAQLEVLNDVSKAISIATAALSLGTAISAGDPACIVAATLALGHAVAV